MDKYPLTHGKALIRAIRAKFGYCTEVHMEVKVKKVFRDKNTGELYEVGQILSLEEARAEELLADKRKLVEKVVKKTTKRKKS